MKATREMEYLLSYTLNSIRGMNGLPCIDDFGVLGVKINEIEEKYNEQARYRNDIE